MSLTISTLYLHLTHFDTYSLQPTMCLCSAASVCVSKLSCTDGHSGPTHESMQAVFDLQPFRPAVNLSSPTVTNISFTLYAVLGVVSFTVTARLKSQLDLCFIPFVPCVSEWEDPDPHYFPVAEAGEWWHTYNNEAWWSRRLESRTPAQKMRLSCVRTIFRIISLLVMKWIQTYDTFKDWFHPFTSLINFSDARISFTMTPGGYSEKDEFVHPEMNLTFLFYFQAMNLFVTNNRVYING